MKTTEEKINGAMLNCIMKEEVFDAIMGVIREHFVAIFMNESEVSSIIRFTNGQKFRLMIEEV